MLWRASSSWGRLRLSRGFRERFALRLRNIVPDYHAISGTHTLTIEARRRPMDSHSMTKGPYSFDATTGHFAVKARGRSFRMTFAGDGSFRMGPIVAYGKPDGGR